TLRNGKGSLTKRSISCDFAPIGANTLRGTWTRGSGREPPGVQIGTADSYVDPDRIDGPLQCGWQCLSEYRYEASRGDPAFLASRSRGGRGRDGSECEHMDRHLAASTVSRELSARSVLGRLQLRVPRIGVRLCARTAAGVRRCRRSGVAG